MKTLKLANGNKTHINVGYRRIVLDPQGQPRHVQTVACSGHKGQRATYQVAREWDIVISHSYNPSTFSIHVLIDGELSLYKAHDPSTIVDIQYRLKELPGVFKWLTSQSGESYLPDGIGWVNGVTQAQINKNERIRSFLKGLNEAVVDRYVELALYSPFTGLSMDWKDANPIPDVLDVHGEFFDGEMAKINEQDEWVLFREKLGVCYVKPRNTTGTWEHPHGCGVFNATPLPMPEDVVKAIKVTVHPYRRDCSSYGIKWTLYKR